MTSEPSGVRIQLMIALMCAALLLYIVLLDRTAVLNVSGVPRSCSVTSPGQNDGVVFRLLVIR
jgi:hypothetical protein